MHVEAASACPGLDRVGSAASVGESSCQADRVVERMASSEAARAAGGRFVLCANQAVCDSWRQAQALSALAGFPIEFEELDAFGVLAADRFEQLFGTPHGTDLVALAQAHGIHAHTVRTADDLRSCLDRPGSQLVRIVSDRTANVARHAQLHAAVVASLDA
jgi:hypothetical protein